MKKRLIQIVGAFLLLAVGATLGPVGIAVVGAWAPGEGKKDLRDSSEAVRLVEAYRQRLPTGLLFLTVIPPEDGAECGYDPYHIFPDSVDQLEESIRSKTFVGYAGYFALNRWRNESRDEEWISAITASIDEQMSEFEAGFLRRCIEATIFSDKCMQRVAEFGDTVPRFDPARAFAPHLGIGIEDQIVCTYIDGVAARRNIPLSPWNTGAE